TIVNSTTIPHISILGTGNGTFDYYSFVVANAGDSVTFDMDGANFDTELFLYDTAGNLLASNDDDGSFDLGDGTVTTLDSRLAFTFGAAGTFVIGVGRFNSFDLGGGAGIGGTTPQPGNVYTLHTSLTGHAVGALGSNVRLQATAGDLTVGSVTAAGDIVNLIASGAITDGDGGNDVTALGLRLGAG